MSIPITTTDFTVNPPTITGTGGAGAIGEPFSVTLAENWASVAGSFNSLTTKRFSDKYKENKKREEGGKELGFLDNII